MGIFIYCGRDKKVRFLNYLDLGLIVKDEFVVVIMKNKYLIVILYRIEYIWI